VSTVIARFDMRAPGFATPAAELYREALEMATYAEEYDFTAVAVSEHHASDDGYLPSPLVLASAFAARTSKIAINVAALLLPLYDPIKLAEDMAVLDHISAGRVSYVLGIGYRPAEFEALGRDFKARGRDAEAYVALMRQAWSGDEFTHEGRTVRVLPRPFTEPHPMLFYGGGSVAAAKRAARLDLPFFPQLNSARITDAYHEERARLGLEPGFAFAPPDGPLNVFVSEDPDATWRRVGECLLHDARSYARWQVDAGMTSVALDESKTVDELKRAGVYTVLTPDECISLLQERESVALHPLCGGTPPDIGWETMELVATKVLPAVRAAS
jgi:alkanesulfonate monooxygenase SsuD/methylene tetrahydromethanopterin reductase-like flavin-dependent oxidoreductase (luciferase family)